MSFRKKLKFYLYFDSRGCDVHTRRRYVNILESVKENGGEVRIFSSLHVSGERKQKNIKNKIQKSNRIYFLLFFISELNQFTGIAAILRFPMPELEDEEDEEEENDEQNEKEQKSKITIQDFAPDLDELEIQGNDDEEQEEVDDQENIPENDTRGKTRN